MSTLEEVLRRQRSQSILQAPTEKARAAADSTTSSTNPTLQISLQNNTNSLNVWAYITGLDINRDNAVFLLRSDGVTPYYPVSPPETLSPLTQDCHIQLGPPGTTRAVTIPQLAGGRIWFCVNDQLTFMVNPGPALVEPSVMNPTDANYAKLWSFVEFTFNKIQLFANVTYVDFVAFPISLALSSNSNPGGPAQRVPGIPAWGMDRVASEMVAQHNRDGADWDKLVIRDPASGNRMLRVLSPNSGIKLHQDLPMFRDYYQPYVDAVWSKYTSTPLNLDTQAEWGVLRGLVAPPASPPPSLRNAKLTFPTVGSFPQPSTEDIFSCSTGAFANHPGPNSHAMGAITARLAAALNRSTLLSNPNQPDGEVVSSYYRDPMGITNHYSRAVHEASLDGRGYAFPYDDVAPREEENVAGTVADGDPGVFVVAVGGEAVLPLGSRADGRTGTGVLRSMVRGVVTWLGRRFYSRG